MNDMTAVSAGPPSVIFPADAMQRMQLCRELSTARLVPAAFQKSPADIFLAMNTLERLKLDFFMTIGECYVVSNKIGFSGKLAAAIINTSSIIAERLSYEYSGEEGSDGRTITVRGRLANELEPRVITLSLGEAKTKNEQWVKQPDQMLAYAGSRTWGRRHTPEVLLGMLFKDEVEDMIDVTPQGGPKTVTPATQKDRDKAIDHQAPIATPVPPPHEEPHELEGPRPDAGETMTQAWRSWCQRYINLYRTSTSLEEAETWERHNYHSLKDLDQHEPKMMAMLVNAMDIHKRPMRPAPEGNTQ